MTKQLHRILLLLFVLLVAVACRQEAPLSADNVNLDITVTDSLVGETTLIVSVTDDEGNAIENPGTLNLRGDMDHAGMVPVIVDAEDSDNGVFTVPFEWTMGGAWTVEATLTLPNDETVTQTFDYEILTEAGEDDMADMDMSGDEDADMDMADDTDAEATEEVDMDADASAADEDADADMTEEDMDVADDAHADAEATEDTDMDMAGDADSDEDMDMSDESEDTEMDMSDESADTDMDMSDDESEDMSDMDMDSDSHDMGDMHMGGETSAVYMQITNNGEETVTITGANTAVAGIVEVHETVIENDVARMQPVDMIVIEAGETVELRPGGLHIMLLEVSEDIVVDETIDVELLLESDDAVAVTALVQDMLMDDLEGEIIVGDLTITNIWARPASAGMMDMDSEEEMDMSDESEDMGDMEMDAISRWDAMVATTELIGTNPMDMDMSYESEDMGDMDSEEDMDMTDESDDMGDMDSDATEDAEMDMSDESADADMEMDAVSRWDAMVATTELIGTNSMDMSHDTDPEGDMEDTDMSDESDDTESEMNDMDSEEMEMFDESADADSEEEMEMSDESEETEMDASSRWEQMVATQNQ